MRWRDHERFNNVASGVQSLIVAAAVVIGGFWTVFTFGLVDWAERKRLANSGLSISIEARQEEPVASDQGYVIVAQVRITNRSDRPRPVVFEEAEDKQVAPLKVETVQVMDGISSVKDLVFVQRNVHTPSRVIRSGETVEYPYVVTVSQAGIYRVSLWVKLLKEEYDVHVESGGTPDPASEIYWDAQAYVFVR